MLIDDLLSADVISNLDAEGARRFKRRLREAIKFELAADFSAAAEGLADNFTNLAKAIPFCKVPFKSCWFEASRLLGRYAGRYDVSIQGSPVLVIP
jgi:hypothetical protein